MSFLLDSYLLSLLGDGLPGFDVLNIFLQADDRPTSENSANLFIFSTTNSGVETGIDLMLEGDTGELEDTMNLFCHASDPMGQSGVMSMFVAGGMYPLSSEVSLVLENSQNIIESGVDLVMVGDGEFDGALPTSDSMNLVIQRDPNEVVPLFLCSGTPEDESMPLFIQSINSLETGGLGDDPWTGPLGVPLVVPSTKNTSSSSTKLFVHGF